MFATFLLSNNRYKVHYIGYSTKYDEWKTRDELLPIDECNEESKPFTYVFVKCYWYNVVVGCDIQF